MLQGTPCDATGRQGKLSLAAVLPRQIRARRAVAMDRQQARTSNQSDSDLGTVRREVENKKACGQKMRGDKMEKG